MLSSSNKCFRWLTDDAALNHLGFQKKLSRAGAWIDRSGTFLNIGVPQSDANKVSKETDSSLYYGLLIVML